MWDGPNSYRALSLVLVSPFYAMVSSYYDYDDDYYYDDDDYYDYYYYYYSVTPSTPTTLLLPHRLTFTFARTDTNAPPSLSRSL